MPAQNTVFGIILDAPDNSGIERLAVAISTSVTEFQDFSRMWDDLENVLQRNERKLFATEGAHAGQRWARLSERYARAKVRRYGRRKILAASGAMREALTKSGATHALRAKTDRRFVFGTQGLDYPGVHQNPKPENPLPRRPPLAYHADIEDEIANEVLRKHTNRAARAGGFRYTDTPGDVTGTLMPEDGA